MTRKHLSPQDLTRVNAQTSPNKVTLTHYFHDEKASCVALCMKNKLSCHARWLPALAEVNINPCIHCLAKFEGLWEVPVCTSIDLLAEGQLTACTQAKWSEVSALTLPCCHCPQHRLRSQQPGLCSRFAIIEQWSKAPCSENTWG